MKEIDYFDRELFLKGKLAICMRTQFEVDSCIQKLPSLINNEIELSEYNLRSLEISMDIHNFAYVRVGFTRYGCNFTRFCTGNQIETAQLHGCDSYVNWSSIECSLLSPSLEEFLKDFW